MVLDPLDGPSLQVARQTHLQVNAALADATGTLTITDDDTLSFTLGTINTGNADYPFDIQVADIDGDGDLDVVSVSFFNNTVAWYENDGGEDPSFTVVVIDDDANYPNEIHVADLDGDGDLDLVTNQTGTDSITWYENNLK